jgi:hypothetical protein
MGKHLTKDELRGILEEQDVSEDQINEFLEIYKDGMISDLEEDGTIALSKEEELLKFGNIEDWRERAKLAASIISKNLEYE